ncbi:hypothetical protein PHMEG_00034203 [Phytophthora megakarya]|uniref:Uncharacterized protein n=1 Tax=Phytophthora megakarya TaxID=4795 RepID=A0A225URV1_9STRA|nr:hypothetical protein PHMEG_00034203 [Phytophthora megakarya]
MYITQQQQQYQAQIKSQMQAQMQQANERFEYLIASRSDHKKKDPPVYELEDIELWIFATEQYYTNKHQLIEAEPSDAWQRQIQMPTRPQECPNHRGVDNGERMRSKT